jgi:C-methyltransferase
MSEVPTTETPSPEAPAPDLPALPSVVAEVDEVGLKVAVLRAALELDVFALVADSADTVGRLAQQAACAPQGIEVLVRALCSLGLLERDGGRLRCSRGAAAYLTPGGAGYSAPVYLGWLRNRDRLAEAVRSGTGPTDHAAEPAEDEWRAYAAPDLVRWRDEAPGLREAFAGRGVTLLPGQRVLDLGCGSGIVGFALARDVAGATVLAVDRPGVLELAADLAAAMGMADRVTLVAGDAAAAPLGTADADLAVLTNVAQYLDDRRLSEPLARVHRALRPGGRAYLTTVVVDEGSADLPMNWSSAIEMFLNSSVDSRTSDEVAGLLASAGFTDVVRLEPYRFLATA